MQRSVEGLIIAKYPYGERHLICHLLLRSGNKISVLFMGGRGGGKKVKPGGPELGYLIKVELRRSRSTAVLAVAKEWIPQWAHQNIRFHYRAFHLMCFFLELTAKIATEEDLHSPREEVPDNEKTFGTLANGLFYLEQKAAGGAFSPPQEASVFLSKLLIAQGVFPSLGECIFCGLALSAGAVATFVAEQGGFSCTGCSHRSHLQEEALWQFLIRIGGSSYKELAAAPNAEVFRPGLLLSYFCHQFQLDMGKVKTRDVVNL